MAIRGPSRPRTLEEFENLSWRKKTRMPIGILSGRYRKEREEEIIGKIPKTLKQFQIMPWRKKWKLKRDRPDIFWKFYFQSRKEKRNNVEL